MSFAQIKMPHCGGVQRVYACCTLRTPSLHTNRRH
jgi:hypothetical protein